MQLRLQFVWKGLELHLGRRRILTLVQDETYPHLYRIRYPDGWISSPANISRAADAAYGHARYLLGSKDDPSGVHSPEEQLAVVRPPEGIEEARP